MIPQQNSQKLRYGIKMFTFLIKSNNINNNKRTDSENNRHIKAAAQSPDLVFHKTHREQVGWNKQ